MFTLTIETDNPAVIKAIAEVVKNTPPAGFQSLDAGEMPEAPTEVTIHTTEAKVEEATAAVNTTPDATVKVEEPTDVEATKERGQKIRQLLLAVSKLEGKTIQDAKTIAANAAGIGMDAFKDLPGHPKAGDAIAALEAAL